MRKAGSRSDRGARRSRRSLGRNFCSTRFQKSRAIIGVAVEFYLIHESRKISARLHLAENLSVWSNSGLNEFKDVLHGVFSVLVDSHHFRDMGNFAGTIMKAFDLYH